MFKAFIIALMASLTINVHTATATEQYDLCDLTVVLGDSLISRSPIVYAEAFANLGIDALILSGAGRAIDFPDVQNDNTITWVKDGHIGTLVSYNTHMSGIESVEFARRAYPNKDLCWVVALGTNDAAHLPESWWDADIDKMTTALGGDLALWIPIYMDSKEWDGYTPEVAEAWHTRFYYNHDIMAISLWDEFASANAEAVLSDDGVHLTEYGSWARALYIASGTTGWYNID